MKKSRNKSKKKSILRKLPPFIITSGIAAAIIGFLLIKFCSNNLPPEAKIVTSQDKGEIPFSVIFDGAKSSDPESKKLKYFWYIDDILVSEETNFEHTFRSSQNYRIKLTVKDPSSLPGNDIVIIRALPKKLVGNEALSNKAQERIEQEFKEIYSNLAEETIRRDISDFLRDGKLDYAILLLGLLSSEEAKDEECMLVFNYCINKGKLKEAKVVAEFFRLPSQRNKAHERISLEAIKQKRIERKS